MDEMDEEEHVIVQKRSVIIVEEEHADKWDHLVNAVNFYRKHGIPEGDLYHDEEWRELTDYMGVLAGIIFGSDGEADG